MNRRPLILFALVGASLLLGKSGAIAEPSPPAAPSATSDRDALNAVLQLLDNSHFGEAAPALRRLAAAGNAHAQCLRGLTLLTGAGLPLNPEDGIQELRRAATGNNQLAARFLLQLSGGNAATDDENQLWQELARRPPRKDEPLPATLGLVGNGKPELSYFLAALWNREQAAQGDAMTCYNLARFYRAGAGVPRNLTEYRNWLTKSGNLGFAPALEELAILAFTGAAGEPEDSARGAALILRAAEAGSANSQFIVAKEFLSGRSGRTKDSSEAVRWLEQAAAQDHPEALAKLADLVRAGNGTPRDDQRAVTLYERAATLGNADARSSLGWMYEVGRGVAKDPSRAAALYREAAEAKDVWAMQALGHLYRRGTGVPQDFGKAREWFLRAATAGNAAAMNALGWLYAEGQGTQKDDAVAFDWFDQAAAEGHADSQNTVGWRLLQGEGVARDPQESVTWFTLAAEQSNSRAMYNLVDVYSSRFGAPYNRAEVRRWRLRLAECEGAPGQIEFLRWASANEYESERARKALDELRSLVRDANPETAANAQAALAEALMGALLPSLRSPEEGLRLADELMKKGDHRGTALVARIFATGAPGVPRDSEKARRLAESLSPQNPGRIFVDAARELDQRNLGREADDQAYVLLQLAIDLGDPTAREQLSSLEARRTRPLPSITDTEALLRRSSLTNRGSNAPPAVVFYAAPAFPPQLELEGLTGEAVIELIVTEDGSVKNPHVIKATNELFGGAALESVGRCRFSPALQDGQPRASNMQLTISFSLDSRGTSPTSAASDGATQLSNESLESTPWTTDYRAALKQAKAQSRPVLLLFTGSDWCPPCKRLEKEILTTPEFARFARENLIAVFLDYPRRKKLATTIAQQNAEVAKHYDVQSYPTVLMVSPDGRVLGKLGYAEGGPKPYTRAIARILRANTAP